jgi:hypothetical protein
MGLLVLTLLNIFGVYILLFVFMSVVGRSRVCCLSEEQEM